MYSQTITLFNCYSSRTSGITWFPTVIKNVNVRADKASIMASFGAESTDNAVVKIKYRKEGDRIVIADKTYLPPKEWAQLLNDELGDYITFKSGKLPDFLVVGEYGDGTPIKDEDYTEGFLGYMLGRYDNVFTVSSASNPYELIPHFRILAK